MPLGTAKGSKASIHLKQNCVLGIKAVTTTLPKLQQWKNIKKE